MIFHLCISFLIALFPLVSCGRPVDVVLALEMSSIVRDSDVSDLSRFLLGVMDLMRVTRDLTRVGIVTYGEQVSNIRYLNTDIDNPDLYRNVIQDIEGLRQVSPYGNSNISGCLETIREQQLIEYRGIRRNTPNVVLLISAQRSNIDAHRTISEAEALKDYNTRLLVVGIGDRIDRREIESIATDGGLEQTTWILSDYSQLSYHTESVAKAMCIVHPPLPPPTLEPVTRTDSKYGEQFMLYSSLN